MKDGPANGTAPIPITRDTSGRPVTQVAGTNGIYVTSGGGLIQANLPQPEQTPAQKTAEQQFYENNPTLGPGVYGNVIVTEGSRPKNAGEMISKLQGGAFYPARSHGPLPGDNDAYKARIASGSVPEEKINPGDAMQAKAIQGWSEWNQKVDNWLGPSKGWSLSPKFWFGPDLPHELRMGVEGFVLKDVGGAAYYGSQIVAGEVYARGYNTATGNFAATAARNRAEGAMIVPFGIAFVKGTYEDFKSGPRGTAEQLAPFAIGGAAEFVRNPANPIARFVEPKLFPEKFTTTEESGIKFVEANTVPTQVSELKAFEGKEVPTTHVTTSDIFGKRDEFTTISITEGAGKMRSENQLFNFYKASPESETVPRAYLGYAGIGESSSSSGAKVIKGPTPTIRVLQFQDKISPTPSGLGDMQAINKWQVARPGTTYVPAENIAGRSIEGQFISPSKYQTTENPGKIAGFFGAESKTTPIPGFEGSQGTIIRKSGDSKFLFYKQTIEGPKNPVANFVFKALGKDSKYYKFEIIPAKTLPVDAEAAKLIGEGKVGVVDLPKYNAEYSKGVRYESSVSRVVFESSPGVVFGSASNVFSSELTLSSSPSLTSSSKTDIESSSLSQMSSSNSSATGSSGYGSSGISRTGGSTSPIFSSGSSPIGSSTSKVPSNVSNIYSGSSGRSGYGGYPGFSPSFSPPKSVSLSSSPKGKRYANGWLVQIKRKGKFVTEGFGLSRADALNFGQKRTMSDLSATFRIRPDNSQVEDDGGFSRVNNNVFRGYKVKNGVKIGLDDTYIQRQGKRLGTGAEIRSIQGAKRMKGWKL